MNLPLITRAREHNDKTAIVTTDGAFTYRDLLHTSSKIATYLLQDAQDLEEQRVAFLIPNGFEYVATLWEIWRAGGIAVPLCISHPRPELEYVIINSGASIIVAHPNFEAILGPIAQEHIKKMEEKLPSFTSVQQIKQINHRIEFMSILNF